MTEISRKEFEELKARVTKLEKENVELKEETSKLKKRVTELEAKVMALFMFALVPLHNWLCGETGSRRTAELGKDNLIAKYPELIESLH